MAFTVNQNFGNIEQEEEQYQEEQKKDLQAKEELQEKEEMLLQKDLIQWEKFVQERERELTEMGNGHATEIEQRIVVKGGRWTEEMRGGTAEREKGSRAEENKHEILISPAMAYLAFYIL